jgi:hypothetical protein
MTGPLVGVTVLQPANGTVVLPGQSVTCSGRATGHGGPQTTLVDRVVLNLDRGSDIEADLSPVMPKPAVPAVNWAASVTAPGQPGPHDLTITAFPDDGGAPASVTIGFTVQVPPPGSALTPQQSLELSLVNPDPPGPGDWASAIVKANRSDLDFTAVLDDVLFLDRGDTYPVCGREWNQVTAPGDDYDRDTVGFSGWLLAPDISGADVPFTHPFGRDWECQVVVDPLFAGLPAPGNIVIDKDDEELQQAAAEAQDLGVLKALNLPSRRTHRSPPSRSTGSMSPRSRSARRPTPPTRPARASHRRRSAFNSPTAPAPGSVPNLNSAAPG